MANTLHSKRRTVAPTISEQLALEIGVDASIHGVVIFVGSRAAIEAEGLIPQNVIWPVGQDSLMWSVGELKFWLYCRPPVGPNALRVLSEFGSAYFRIICSHARDFPDITVMKRRMQALNQAEAERANSPAGRQQAAILHGQYSLTLQDAGYQAFRGLFLGLTPPPKRGRKPKAGSSIGGVQ